MNYISLRSFLAKVAKIKTSTKDFHQEFIDAAKEHADKLKVRVPNYAVGTEASMIRAEEQAALINKLLKIIRQKASGSNLSPQDQQILMEYWRIVQLTLLEKQVKDELKPRLDRTLVKEIAKRAATLKRPNATEPLAKTLGLNLDTLNNLYDVMRHFEQRRQYFLTELASAQSAQNTTDIGKAQENILDLAILQRALISSRTNYIDQVADDDLTNLCEKAKLNGMYSGLVNLGSAYPNTDTTAQNILNAALQDIMWKPQQDASTASRLYLALCQAQARIQTILPSCSDPAIKQENENFLAEISQELAEIHHFKGSVFQSGLQKVKDKMALTDMVEQALDGMSGDASMLPLRSVLLQLKRTIQGINDATLVNDDGLAQGKHKKIIKKLLLEIAQYEKANSSFFKNPFSSSRRAMKELSKELEQLCQVSPNFRAVKDEVTRQQSQSHLALVAKDHVDSNYNVTLPQKVLGAVLALNDSWRIRHESKIIRKHHLQRAEQFKNELETLAQATEMSHLTPQLKQIISLTHYGHQQGDKISAPMRDEAVMRCLLSELHYATHYRDVDGEHVSHKKGYVMAIREIIAKQKNHCTLEAHALIIAAEIDISCMNIKFKDKKSTDAQDGWSDYLRDEIYKLSQRIGQAIPASLSGQYPGKQYYDGEIILKEYAKFLLAEERNLSLHDKDYPEVHALVKEAIEKLKEFLPQDFKDYIQVLRDDTKRAKKEGEKVELATIGARIHYRPII